MLWRRQPFDAVAAILPLLGSRWGCAALFVVVPRLLNWILASLFVAHTRRSFPPSFGHSRLVVTRTPQAPVVFALQIRAKRVPQDSSVGLAFEISILFFYVSRIFGKIIPSIILVHGWRL